MLVGCGAASTQPAVSIDGAIPVDAGTTDSAIVTGAGDTAQPGSTSCPQIAGRLTLYAIAPPASLDWSTPNKLLNSVVASATKGDMLTASAQAKLAHEIGHMNEELDCGEFSIPLTGQTGGGNEWESAASGFGIVLQETAGTLQEFPSQEHDDTITDIQLRQTSGLVTRISFDVNAAMCQRIKTFHDEYVQKSAYVHYGSLDRARRFEGAGCATFGAGIIDVSGLLRRSVYSPVWARSVLVGSARFSDFLGPGYYAYGSDLVAPDGTGKSLFWPKGVAVPASSSSAVILTSAVLDAWTGSEDMPFAVAGLPSALATQIPFSLYDPELMAEWAEKVWAEADSKGSASALGALWTANIVDHAHEIVYDAHCVQPQTIAFEADNDDLFKDADAP